jgi:hypothetical protein
VQRDAERLEQGGFVVPDGRGQSMEQPAGPGHQRSERAVGRAEPGKPAIEAHVRVTAPTWLARPTSDSRITDDPFACPRAVDDDAAELVAEHERTLEPGVADRALAVPMQIRAAQADRRHSQEHLVRAAGGDRLRADPEIAGAVEAGNDGAIGIGHRGRWP